MAKRRQGARKPTASNPAAPDDDRSVLTAALAAYRKEFGDAATERSSVTRVLRLMRTHTVPRDAALALLAEAASRTRESERLGTIDGHRFAYFLSVFGQLLQPEPVAPALAPPPESSPVPVQGSPAPSQVTPTGELPVSSRALPGETPPQAIAETHPVWKETLSELQAVMTHANFNTWLATTRVIGQAGSTLTVSVPRQFHKDWLEQKMRSRIASTMERLGHGGLKVEFVVSNGTG